MIYSENQKISVLIRLLFSVVFILSVLVVLFLYLFYFIISFDKFIVIKYLVSVSLYTTTHLGAWNSDLRGLRNSKSVLLDKLT